MRLRGVWLGGGGAAHIGRIARGVLRAAGPVVPGDWIGKMRLPLHHPDPTTTSRWCLAPFLAAVLWFAPGDSREALDLTGVWALDRDLSNPQTRGPDILLRIQHSEVSVLMERRGPTTTSVTFFFDGRPPMTSLAAGTPHPLHDYAAAGAKARLQGRTLIIEGGTATQGARPQTVLRETWRIDPVKRTLTADRAFDSGRGVYQLTEVFRKVE